MGTSFVPFYSACWFFKQTLAMTILSTTDSPSMGPLTPVSMECMPRQIKSIPADVVFGSPKDDCRGTGICRISTSFNAPSSVYLKKDCRCARGVLLVASNGHPLSLLFRATDLCSHLLRHFFFEKTIFEMQHPCALPVPRLSLFGQKNWTLPAGKHTVTAGKGYYRIDFQVA